MQKRTKDWAAAFDAAGHVGEVKVVIGGVDYGADDLVTVKITRAVLDDGLSIGGAVAATAELEVVPKGTIPRAAEVRIYYRLWLKDAHTDWVTMGIFYLNTREADGRYLKLECYDAMLKAQQDYLADVTADDWPKAETECVAEIAARIGVELDSRTKVRSGNNHMVSMPVGRTMRDVLQDIAVTNGGNWCMTPAGRLWLAPLTGTGDTLPPVGGRPDMGAKQTVTGVRLIRGDQAEWLAGTEDGLVVEASLADATRAQADELCGRLKGLVYEPFVSDGRHIDPLAEVGDRIEVGGHTVTVWSLTETLCASFYADLETPEQQKEAEQEYPYLTETQRVQRRVTTLETTTAEIRKTQASIELEVTSVKLDLANNYSTTEETKSLIKQTADAIVLSVSKTYATQDSVSSQITQTANSITATVSQTYATKDSVSSQIKQTAESITAEVGKNYTKVGEVRTKFAMDTTSVNISAGTVAFLANTLKVDSDCFKLDGKGSCSIKGNFSTEDAGGGYYVNVGKGAVRVLTSQGAVRGLIQARPDSDSAYFEVYSGSENLGVRIYPESIEMSAGGVNVFQVNKAGDVFAKSFNKI